MTEEVRNIWFFVFTGDWIRDTSYKYQGILLTDAILRAAWISEYQVIDEHMRFSSLIVSR